MTSLSARFATLSRLSRWFGVPFTTTSVTTGIGFPGFALDPADVSQVASVSNSGSGIGEILTLTVAAAMNVTGLYSVTVTVGISDGAGTKDHRMNLTFVRGGVDVAILAEFYAQKVNMQFPVFETYMELREGDLFSVRTLAAGAASDIYSATIRVVPIIT